MREVVARIRTGQNKALRRLEKKKKNQYNVETE